MSQTDTERSHAVVIGASLAGLLAARVLGDHFERITLIEKDVTHDHPESRKGQAQTKHLHGLLASGLRILEDLYPGITNEMTRCGAIYDDMGTAIKWYQHGGYKRQFTSGLKGVVLSRPLLEHLVRRRTLAMPGIAIRDGCNVEGWRMEDAQVTGVHITPKGSGVEAVPADLVVDTSGRGSRTPAWLEAAGYKPPRCEEILVRLGYSTRIYERKAGDLPDAKIIMSLPSPPREVRSGYLFPIEGDRWMLTVGGWHGDYPPDNEKDLLSFVRGLPASDLCRIVSSARPLSDVITYRFRSSRRMRYDKLRHFPSGLLVLGDAVASFNPVYGQGMTSAAMQAKALGECLQSGAADEHMRVKYFKRAARITGLPWQMAAMEDFRFTKTSGPKPLGTDLINMYTELAHRATRTDTAVYKAFLEVMNLLKKPVSLMRPDLMFRVFRAACGL